MTLRLRVSADGSMQVSGMPVLLADSLLRIPGLLRSDDPQVRQRLLPDVYGEDAQEQEWRKHAVPELEHLFLSRAEILQRDLATLGAGADGQYQMTIGRSHQTAWLSSLNAARVALFTLHGLQPQDMDQERDLDAAAAEEEQHKHLAIARIWLMAWLQELLLGA